MPPPGVFDAGTITHVTAPGGLQFLVFFCARTPGCACAWTTLKVCLGGAWAWLESLTFHRYSEEKGRIPKKAIPFKKPLLK